MRLPVLIMPDLSQAPKEIKKQILQDRSYPSIFIKLSREATCVTLHKSSPRATFLLAVSFRVSWL